MPDPGAMREVAIAISGGVGTEILKTAARPWVERFFRDHRPVAIATAMANADAFATELDARMRRLESATDYAERLRASLTDPDVAATLQTAILGAARTSSTQRHRVLADLVAERLKADRESARAVAGSLAVEVMPRLSASHLEWLGLLAVIYTMRLDSVVPDERVPGLTYEEAQAVARPAVEEYRSWLDRQLAVYESLPPFNPDVAAHLVSASVITYERSVRRELAETLLPRPKGPPHRGTTFNVYLRSATQSLAWRGGWLGDAWAAGLQHGRPTPAGLLIGCSVHDHKTGGGATSEWEWSEAAAGDGAVLDEQVWDGSRLDDRLVDAIEKALGERVRRGGGRRFDR